MGEAGENRGKVQITTTQVLGFSRDLLQKFKAPGNFDGKAGEEKGNVCLKDEEEIELSLGLSLNGKFGIDPKKDGVKLMRSSSTSTTIFTLSGEENHACVVPAALYAPLVRTCSLPLNTQEELRKRKELQSLKRMEAKRRRMDKLKFLKLGREKVGLEGNDCEENGGNINGNGEDLVCNNANGTMLESQGSVGSQVSASSGLSELERQPIRGSKNKESKSASNNKSQQLHKEMKLAITSGISTERPFTIVEGDKGANKSRDLLRNVMPDMPCVSTVGEGPNGKRIDGFLYRYKNGEEVKIVCVCHGSSLTPAEFVRHAGGGDVERPLRHIVVSSSAWL